MQRTMPRDLFDLWYLFENENLNIEDYVHDFQKKTEFKKLNPNELVKVVQGKKQKFEQMWNGNLVNQIKEIPNFDDVWRHLGKHWRQFEKIVKD